MAELGEDLAFDLDNLAPPPPVPPIAFPPPPAADSGAVITDFGQDILCVEDLDPQLQLVGGIPDLGQALLHRFTTPSGSLFYDPDYGFDTRQILEEAIDNNVLQAYAMQLRNEAQKDERIQSSTVNLTFDPTQDELQIQVNANTASGPFVYVLSVTALTVALLSTSAQA